MNFGQERYREIARLLGVDPRFSGAGLRFDIGALFPQTGPGALYGEHVGDMPNLACRHVAAMGGPKFNLIMRDNRTGDVGAGRRALEQLHAAGVKMLLSTYSANFGTLLSDIERYEMFTIDGGGGAPLYAQAKPFFWGSIATTPNDAMAGTIAFVKTALPHAATFATIGWELGGLDAEISADASRYFEGTGFNRTVDVKAKVGATDHTPQIAALAAGEFDFVFCFLYGVDVGHFLKQYAAAGLTKPVFAFTHSDAARKIAGPAYDGLYFAFDYFDPDRPVNPWAQFFVEAFTDLHDPGYSADNYIANTYEDVFVFWACIRRVLERGGDPHDSRQLEAALRADPSFPSLYGGSATAAGTLRFDLTTHSVDDRPMTMARAVGNKIVPLAYFKSGRPAVELV